MSRQRSQESIEKEEGASRFVRLFTTHERCLRRFVFSLVVNRDSVDEVMQEVSTVLWKKFAQLDKDGDFLKWSYVIARYEVLMHRRRHARDRLVFDEALMSQLSDELLVEGVEENAECMRKCLAGCLEQLQDGDRRMLLAAYASGSRISHLAEKLNVTANSLYKALSRLRRKLQHCVDAKMNSATI